MPVKGINRANKELDKISNQICNRMLEKGLYIAATVGAGYATLLTPVDTSNLINSQYIKVNNNSDGVSVSTGYTANYAAAVHGMSGKLKGQPRSSVKSFTTKSGQVAFESNNGNFWDPDAEPEFLSKGFNENLNEIWSAFNKAMKL